MGFSTLANIVAGLFKMKLVALLLGPAGVGLVGIYQNIVQAAAGISALGSGNVGTRQIAAARADGGDVAVGKVRRALFWGTMILAGVGGLIFWLTSTLIARMVLGNESRSPEIAWLSVAVALTVAAGSQGALLTGMRRVGDLARINVGSGMVGAAFGVLAIWLWGAKGIVAMIIIAPAVTFVLGHLYVARLERPAGPPPSWSTLTHEWREMVQLGVAFMVSGLVATLGQLVVRSLVQRELGTSGLGQFQAAWAIGMTYLGFILSAMGTDYYPRLTAAIKDHEAATRL